MTTEGAGPGSEQATVDAALFSLIGLLESFTLLGLGLIEDPAGKKHRNLDQARNMIDILRMLMEKTRGNLTGKEQELMRGVLTGLQLRYVEAQKAMAAGADDDAPDADGDDSAPSPDADRAEGAPS
jgi:hypothetical protein